jgi:NADPH:quinone reductase-like Zn-dependent oxidoreductase
VVGLDVAGIVDCVGSEVKSVLDNDLPKKILQHYADCSLIALCYHHRNWKEGDRVYYHHDLRLPHGGFAEYSITKSIALCPIPDNVRIHSSEKIHTQIQITSDLVLNSYVF